MDTAKILTELRAERDRIEHAIRALEALDIRPTVAGRRSPGRPRAESSQPRRRRTGLTTAGRKRLSEMMKKRWAERRKNAKAKAKSATA
jgi:hypothetical protein